MKTLPALLLCVLSASSPAWGGENPATMGEASPAGSSWASVTDGFFKQMGLYDDVKPEFRRRCNGLIVTPAGELFIQTSTKGVCTSSDQGATWRVVESNAVSGRCETGHSFAVPYPYDGRMAFYCIDGTGGISLDGGKIWRPFTRFLRMLEWADMDWSERDPRTIFGLTHEPFFHVLSRDGGLSWLKLYEGVETGKETGSLPSVGVVEGGTFIRFRRGTTDIERSVDAGQTWAKVADHRVTGGRPVHYNRNLYWTCTEGVLVSADGKDWRLTGEGARDAMYGPYFGATEQEFMVVTKESFLLTRDGGKTWSAVAPLFAAPDSFRNRYPYYGWDARNNILYASGLGGSVFQLRLP